MGEGKKINKKKSTPVVVKKTVSQPLIEFLREDGFLTDEQCDLLVKEHDATDRPFESLIVEQGYLTDANLGQLIADREDWNFVSLKREGVDREVLMLIPEKVAKKQLVIAFHKTDKGVKVAMNNPNDATLLHLLKKRIGKKVIPYYATVQDIKDHLSLYKAHIQEEFEEIIKAHLKSAEKGKLGLKENATVQIVDLLLARAYESSASDIHIEPYEDETIVRFRIDGVMKEVLTIPKKDHDLIISRIKVMARLRTDEHHAPQDGKLQYEFGGDDEKRIDVRVSVVPTTKGENAVMRLLSDTAQRFTLEQIGYSDKDFTRVMESIQKPWGLILATGPTGSGKTTNLYAILKILNRKEVNVATIEDPVEYNINGITQIQVNNKTDLTFASGLRSIVRQDPDIIMVGEIRDEETADIAVNSAMTGHLVLSTLHTNDAATTLPRLLDMGVEPFLIASTVNVAIGQRLVRKICPKCIQSYETDLDELSEQMPIAVLEKLARGKEKITLYKGAGCKLCHETGYVGRTGVFEVLEIDDDIRKLIMANADADEIKKKAIENGMTTMFDDAREKVLNGITTIEEMLRVIKN